MKKLEPFVYIVLFVVLGAGLVNEGARAAALERKIPITESQLYERLKKGSSTVQIVDIREDIDDYVDGHIPGSIPYPGCSDEDAPEAAKGVIEPSVPTVLVTANGDPEAFEACAEKFTTVRNLAGGYEAWFGADRPEDFDEYTPPSTSAGGGCL